MCGLDPGISPALCIISDPDFGEYELFRLPEVDHSFDPWLLRKLLLKFRVQAITTEKIWGVAGQGISSSTRFTKSAGLAMGVAVGLGITVLEVTPSKWKRIVLDGYDLGDDADPKDRKKIQKQAACKFVHDVYPKMNLRPNKRQRTDDIDLADAVCLADYGLRNKQKFLQVPA